MTQPLEPQQGPSDAQRELIVGNEEGRFGRWSVRRARGAMAAMARTPVLPEATLVLALSAPIEASKIMVCYVRNPSNSRRRSNV